MISPHLSFHLNILRWFAAFMVVLSHMRPLLFVNYSEVENQGSIAIKVFYFLTGFGHEAVMVFFVISGMLVGGVSTQRFLAGQFNGRTYALQRFSRIYLVFIPALLFGYFLDLSGYAFLDASGLYSNTSQYRFSGDAVDRMHPLFAVGNSLMLHEINVPVLGSNGPLWSLAYEWWYYILFFFGIQIFASRERPRRMVVYAILLLSSVYFLPAPILLWFLIWLAGMVVALWPPSRLRVPRAIGYGLFFAALLWSRFDSIAAQEYNLYENFLRDCIVAAGCVALFLSLNGRSSSSPVPDNAHTFMAEFSYTTYLVHVPFLVFSIAFLNVAFGVPFAMQPSLWGMLYFLLILFIVYLYSYGFSLLTERHTEKFRKYLMRRFVSGRGLRMPEGAQAAIPE